MVAAQAMDELDVGAGPVCEGQRVVGMATDRDITVRGVAQGRPADRTPLREVMSDPVEFVHEDQPLDQVRERMRHVRIRRLPVLDRQERLVGMLSLGDLADKADSAQAGALLSTISEPAAPDRSGNSAASGVAGGGSASGTPGGRSS